MTQRGNSAIVQRNKTPHPPRYQTQMGRGFSRSHVGFSEIKAKVLDDKSKLATVKSNEKVKVKEN